LSISKCTTSVLGKEGYNFFIAHLSDRDRYISLSVDIIS
jgi:hypothetical protein